MDHEGTEVHEAVIFRIKDDSNRPIQELLQAPELVPPAQQTPLSIEVQEQIEQNLEFRGVAIADPGTSGYAVADLDAGRYALVCFIPVGTMSFEQLTQEGEEGASPSPGASPGTTASPGGSPSPTSASPAPTPAATPTPTATATGSPAPGGPQGEEAPPHFTRGMVTELTVS